jgi:CelD/BcsL family acetyltransferase involved in cellulose biosynthesis
MSSTTLADTTLLRVREISDVSGLHDMAVPWDALAGDVPFRSWQWTQTWWRHYRDSPSRLFVLLVTDAGDELVGIAPWYVTRSPRQGRVVRFLGSGEVCSDYLTILAKAELAEAVARRLADWLATDAAPMWDLLDLRGAEEGDVAVGCLGRRLAERGHLLDRQPDLSCWRTALSDTWSEFLATLSKSRRERTRALLRRTLDAGRAVVHRVETESQLERALAVLIDLHQKRRQSLSQAGCFASPRFTGFHREMARRLLATGQLRMLWTELDARPVAAEYGFVGGHTIYYYLGGIEPEMAHESPGWLSLAASLKMAIEEGYRSYDFLRGDESYKASWRATARPLAQVRIVGSQTSARMRYSAWRACRDIKGWARRILSRSGGS